MPSQSQRVNCIIYCFEGGYGPDDGGSDYENNDDEDDEDDDDGGDDDDYDYDDH